MSSIMPRQTFRDRLDSYATPPNAAGATIITPPIFYFLALSTARQTQERLPSFRNITQQSIKSAPVYGSVIAVQMFFAKKIEEKTEQLLGSRLAIPSSAFVIGMLSSYPLAAIKSWTGNKPLREFTPLQATLVGVRETLFISSLLINPHMQRVFEENRFGSYGATFSTGFLTGVLSNPADAKVALLQANIPYTGWRQLTRGAGSRGVAVGLFSMEYSALKGYLTPSQAG